jgi:hypothetical protein
MVDVSLGGVQNNRQDLEMEAGDGRSVAGEEEGGNYDGPRCRVPT